MKKGVFFFIYGGLKMEYLEKEINEGELTVLNILTALDCMYSDSFPKHI